MDEINISNRLKMNASMVTKGHKVADIGCDHAYVAIWLIENDIAKSVIAMDVNKGPCDRARDNIEAHGLTEYIEVRQSDGTKELKVGEADTLLIGGMGGRLMRQILSEHKDVTRACSELVLQPQSEPEIIRKCIRELGYWIDKEDMIYEDGKYYVAMHGIKGKTFPCTDDNKQELFDLYGQYLLEHKNEDLKTLLLARLSKYENGMKKGKEATTKELQKKISIVKEGLKYYDM